MLEGSLTGARLGGGHSGVICRDIDEEKPVGKPTSAGIMFDLPRPRQGEFDSVQVAHRK